MTKIASGDITISSDGIYELASDYSGRITVTAKNVKFTSENGLSDVHKKMAIEMTQSDSHLTLQNIKIMDAPASTTQDSSMSGFFAKGKNNNVIKFTGSGNVMTVQGG